MASLNIEPLEFSYLPPGASWRADFESELLRFPSGVHDDICDALGLIGQLLDHMHAPAAAKPDAPKSLSGYSAIRSPPSARRVLTL